MEQSIFKYVLGRLSVLSDDEIKSIDFNSAMKSIKEMDIPEEDLKSLEKLFSSIPKYYGIEHFGIKGMKWGIRRYQNADGSLTPAGLKRYQDQEAKKSIFGTASSYKVKTKSGEEISVDPVKPLSTAEKVLNAIFGVSEKDELGRRGDANYTLSNSKGEKIGELSLISKSKDVAYIDWITVDKSNRGKGYATDILNDLFQKAKDSGYSKIELNALKKPRPLYERLGFTYKDTSKMSIMDRISSFEFGCKPMEYDLNKVKHSDIFFYSKNEDYIYHYGIKGQKWGVRRYQNKDGSLTSSGKKKYRTRKSKDSDKSNSKKAIFKS